MAGLVMLVAGLVAIPSNDEDPVGMAELLVTAGGALLVLVGMVVHYLDARSAIAVKRPPMVVAGIVALVTAAAAVHLVDGPGKDALDAPIQTALSAAQVPSDVSTDELPHSCPSAGVVSQILGIRADARRVLPFDGPCSFSTAGDALRAAVGPTAQYNGPGPATLEAVRSALEGGLNPDVNGLRDAPADLGEAAVESFTRNEGYWVTCTVYLPGPDGLAWWAQVMVMDDAADIPCAAAEELARQWRS